MSSARQGCAVEGGSSHRRCGFPSCSCTRGGCRAATSLSCKWRGGQHVGRGLLHLSACSSSLQLLLLVGEPGHPAYAYVRWVSSAHIPGSCTPQTPPCCGLGGGGGDPQVTTSPHLEPPPCCSSAARLRHGGPLLSVPRASAPFPPQRQGDLCLQTPTPAPPPTSPFIYSRSLRTYHVVYYCYLYAYDWVLSARG